MPDPVPEAELVKAPEWRRGLAGLIDGATTTALQRAGRRLAPTAGDSARTRAINALAAVMGHSMLLERIGSPGKRAAGVRTVDRRTGEPVELWRAALLTALATGIRSLRPRLMPPSRDDEWQRQQEALARETAAIRARYPDDEDARNAALMELWQRRKSSPVGADFGRILLVNLALSLAARRVQRRLAPTIVVRRR
jgi:hypothetical protein